MQKELLRKSIHTAGIFLLPILYWNRSVYTLLLFSFLLLYLTIEFLDRKQISLPVLTSLTKRCKRDEERGRLAKGPLLLVLSALLAPFLFGTQAAAIGLSQVFIADTASTLVGMKWGQRKLPYSQAKSWAGSLAFFLTATTINLIFVPSPTVPFPKALLLALVGTAIESLPLRDSDNLTVPLGVSWVASFLL